MSRTDLFRNEFPTLKELTYLDTAFVCPQAISVYKASREFLDHRFANPGAGDEWFRTIEKTRAMIAAFIGAEPEEIAFATSAAAGSNIVAHGLSIGPGNNVVLDNLSYPTDLLLWYRKAKEIGFELRIVTNEKGRIPLGAMKKSVDDRTKLINISQVSYNNGFRHNLKHLAELAHRHGAYLFSDSTQAVGALKIDVKAEDVDFLTCAVYKWMLGPTDLAFFYIKKELQEKIRPFGYGWRQIRKYGYSQDQTRSPDIDRSHLYNDARRYEFGSVNFHGMYSLLAALQLRKKIDLGWVEKRVFHLNGYLKTKLAEIGVDLFTARNIDSCITTFLNQNEIQLQQYLNQRKIKVTARRGCNQIRVSPFFFNTEDEIDRLVYHIVKWRDQGGQKSR